VDVLVRLARFSLRPAGAQERPDAGVRRPQHLHRQALHDPQPAQPHALPRQRSTWCSPTRTRTNHCSIAAKGNRRRSSGKSSCRPTRAGPSTRMRRWTKAPGSPEPTRRCGRPGWMCASRRWCWPVSTWSWPGARRGPRRRSTGRVGRAFGRSLAGASCQRTGRPSPIIRWRSDPSSTVLIAAQGRVLLSTQDGSVNVPGPLHHPNKAGWSRCTEVRQPT
jgi:hypothetical protein